jgi:hypothetical protein
MDTVTIGAREWEELSCKIDLIMDFIERQTGRLPAGDNAWLNENEVCEYLKVRTKTLQRLRKSGEVKFSTVGKKHFYKSGDIKALLERMAIKSSKERLEELRNSRRR